MRTSELIAALAADPVPEPIRLDRRVAVALAIGFIGSLAIYALLLGPRPDIAAAVRTVRFNLKFVDAFAFALPSLLLTLRLARPDAKPRALALWLLAPFILLAAGVVVELLVVPSNRVARPARRPQFDVLHADDSALGRSHSRGAHRRARAGAPLHPALTGALAGAASAGVAALLYASHCPDDSPLFVATWYPLATLICMGVGALAGRRFLAVVKDGRETLLLDQRVEDRLQLVHGKLAAVDLAVDDEGRGAVDLDLVAGALADRRNRIDLRLVLEARHRLIMGEAGRAHGGDQRLERLVDERPLVLLVEQSSSMAANALSSPTQRASTKAATSSGLRENSRKMNLTLPVSM